MARHPRPLREDLAGSYVYVPIEPESGFEKEQLFAQQIQERVFRICCVPFFAYGLALGDLVSTDDGHVFISRLRASGRRLVRLYFHDESQIESVLGEVQQMGARWR